MRMGSMEWGLVAVMMAAVPSIGAVQDHDRPTPVQGREVVVEAERLPPTNAPPPPGIAIQPDRLTNRILDEKAQMFVRCARFFPVKLLHRVIDGKPNSPGPLFAMDGFIRANMACWPDLPRSPIPAPPDLASCWPATTSMGLPVCRSVYDRGAVLEEAIARFAPDAELTTRQVDDPAVQARLEAMEANRLSLAYPDERLRARALQCLVRSEPENTTRMVRAHGHPALQTQYVYRILDQGRHCLGRQGAIEVEPLYFRYALTDAFYRWVVAARGVDTLLPVG